MSTPSNQASSIADHTNMPYQVDSEPECNAGTMILPKKTEYQNTHLYEHTIENHSKKRLPNESITVATPSNQASSIADHTNMPYQVDSEPECNAVLYQTVDSHTGTMILPKKTEYQNTHLYEYTIENHSKQRLTNRSITVATSSNYPSPIADHTNMPYQVDSEPECNAILNQTVNSHTGTIMLPKKTEYQNTHLYEHTIEKRSKQRLTNESITVATQSNYPSPIADHTNMPDQVDSEPECNAVLNQTGDS